jgi:hypothetical protein
VSTPGPGGQPPEQNPDPSGQPPGWGQQPPAGQPDAPQQWATPQGASGEQSWSAPQGGPGQQPGFAGQQPGQFPGQFPGQQPGQPAFGAPAQPNKKKKWLPIVGGIVAVLVVVVVLSTFLGGGEPKVGDCIQPDGSSYATVDCGSADAQYRVVGTDADMTGDEFDATPAEEMCTAVPSASVVLWSGSSKDEDGKVFCAADN